MRLRPQQLRQPRKVRSDPARLIAGEVCDAALFQMNVFC